MAIFTHAGSPTLGCVSDAALPRTTTVRPDTNETPGLWLEVGSSDAVNTTSPEHTSSGTWSNSASSADETP